ncbi:MAG: 4a-hydroxytetrahydrobiopterin dehydratase [Gemmatimonadetes bacterium]|nr:4a-hydroxytetrahydrobiopterin dehydratase [Gemmatimonadota bacterium]
MPATPLSDIEIHRELGSLPGWSRRGNTLVKVYAFPDFMTGIGWVRRVAEAAEASDHHPDLDIRYTKITVTLSTHSAGGITVKDFALARAIDALPAVS